MSDSGDDDRDEATTSFEVEEAGFSDHELDVKRARKEEVNGYLETEIEIANQLIVPYQDFPVFEYLSFNKIFDSHLLITLPLDFINKRFREWWGLLDPFIRIRLNFDLSKYRLGRIPEVTASTSYAKRNIAMGAIENFIKDDLEKYWSVRCQDELIGEDNFFASFIDRLAARMKELGNYCVQCGIRHLGAHLLLSVCDRPLCYFQRDRLRQTFGCSIGPRLWTDSALLLNFLFFSANDHRRKSNCKPDPLKDELLKAELIDENGVADALEGYCTRCIFSTWENYEKFRDSPETRIKADLLYWLSDRFPVICRLPPRFRVRSMKSNHQYVLPPVPSEKEERFQACLNRVNGQKFYAFHDSPIKKWYKILCKGLIGRSKTKRPSVEATPGKGIYLGKVPQTSANYSRGYSGGSHQYHHQSTNVEPVCQNDEHNERNKHIGQGTHCLALVEVANDPSKYQEHELCYVVTDPDILQIRVLFAYDSDSSTPRTFNYNFSAGKEDMMKVQEAMDFFIDGDFRERLAAVYDSECDGKALDEEEDLPSHRLEY